MCDHSEQLYADYFVSQEWQKKLSLLKLSDFPWEPKPAPAVKGESGPPNVKPPIPTLPSNGNISNDRGPLNTLPPVKSEPGSYPQQASHGNYPPPNFPQGQNMTAQQRAAMNLHSIYGDRAGAQVATLQQSGQRPQQPMQPGPYIKQEDNSGEPYHPNPSAQSAPIKSSQTDGAGDAYDTWQAEYAKRKADIALNREENDRIIKDHVAASQRRLEGGGVLMPLDDLPSIGRSKLGLRPEVSGPSASLSRAQGDATGDDDDEDDEDAINSDLDDPDELEDDAADADDGSDQVMLCTYDKVQRVKNKWKCTLKDGILRLKESEVLFHKGSGEFEW
jgi:transcription initiation factor TFIIA large subunit